MCDYDQPSFLRVQMSRSDGATSAEPHCFGQLTMKTGYIRGLDGSTSHNDISKLHAHMCIYIIHLHSFACLYIIDALYLCVSLGHV